MTPTARNAAIAAAITLVPALAAAALYPDRARALPGQVSGRVREIFEDDSEVEQATRQVVSRLEGLTRRLESRALADRVPEISPAAAIGAGIAALVLIPAALTALFAPHRFRQAKDAALGYWSDENDIDPAVEDELSGLSERLDTLSADIERQREDNFDAVLGAKNAG